MKLRRILQSILLSAFGLPGAAAEVPDTTDNNQAAAPEIILAADSAGIRYPSTPPELSSASPVDRDDSPDWWINRIKSGTYNIQDSTVIYPGFVKLCVDVYIWGDKFFNSYDPEYVVGTGKKWKVGVKMNNWTDSYVMTLNKVDMRMLSNVYAGVGPYISFMAVSVGYEANLNRLVSHLPARQKRWEFNFSTSLFWLNLYYNANRDGTVIRKFGDYRDTKGHSLIHQPFTGLQLRNYGLDLYYFFNHKRYSQGAAYNFSKIQKKSQGSLLLGVSLSHQYIDLDFSTLPGAFQAELPDGAPKHYNFTYNDYCVILGYGYNYVPGKHWLLNVTALPNVGIKHCMPQTFGGQRELFSLNVKGNGSVVYNLDNFYAGAFAGVDIHWFNNSRVSFANAVAVFGAQAGLRF